MTEPAAVPVPAAGRRPSRRPVLRRERSGPQRLAQLLALLLVVAVAPAAAASRGGDAVGPGCRADEPAAAYLAGGHRVPASRPPVPCATRTGHYTGETTIAVTRGGAAYLSAADWEWSLARTSDAGRHWTAYTVPGPQAFPGCDIGTTAATPCDDSESSKANTVADGFVYTDPRTNRVFWSKTYGLAVCSSLNYSDDGRTWHANTRFACPGSDYEKVVAGPAPAGGARPVGYPDVVYGCANALVPVFVVGPTRLCWASLDGGATFEPHGAPVVPSPLAPGCLHFQEQPAVGPDGTVFQPLNCAAEGQNPAGDVKVALSTDEARTWSYLNVPTGSHPEAPGLIGGVTAGVDSAGTLYVCWTGTDEHVFVASSPDRGATWHGPFDVTLPGVRQDPSLPRAQLAADPRRSGHVAVAYYGLRGKDAVHTYGYLTESFDARSARPTFFGAQLDRSADPLYFPTTGGTLPRNDYLGVTIAPDGVPWAGLVQLASTRPDAQGFVPSTGFVGRLVVPPR